MASRRLIAVLLAAVLLLTAPAGAWAVHLKDISEIDGPVENPIEGTGLVVGLNGTGDDAKFAPAIEHLSNMLRRLGNDALPQQVVASKNVALVNVSAMLPKYNYVGQKLRVSVAAVGNAKSLEGGRLLVCPLLAPDSTGETLVAYATANGRLMIDRDTPTSGHIETGAIVRKSVPAELTLDGKLIFRLDEPYANATVASRVVNAINQDKSFNGAGSGSAIAKALDPRTIQVQLTPEQLADPVTVISELERLSIPSVARDMVATVVIDGRKGLFYAINGNVEISKAVVAYENLQLEIKPQQEGEATTLDDLVKALRVLDASPRDVIGLLLALKDAGALHAKVVRK